eukprot:542274_1
MFTEKFLPDAQMATTKKNADEQQPLSVKGHKSSEKQNIFILKSFKIRITIWCIIYLIFTTASVLNGAINYILYDKDLSFNPEAKQNETYWVMFTISNSILWCTVIIFLFYWYSTICNCQLVHKFVAVLFIIGSITQCVTLYLGIRANCDHSTDKVAKRYCKTVNIASYLWIIVFSIYLACDTFVNSIGNKIRIRIFVKSIILFARSFLLFLVYIYSLNHIPSVAQNASKFSIKSHISGNFLLAFLSLIILIIVLIGYGDSNSNKKLNIWLKRIIQLLVFVSVGITLTVNYAVVGTYFFLYYVFGAILLVYDFEFI